MDLQQISLNVATNSPNENDNPAADDLLVEDGNSHDRLDNTNVDQNEDDDVDQVPHSSITPNPPNIMSTNQE